MADHHDLPFKGEYAKSGRASCKACREAIAKDTLRLAIMVQSPMFDGKVPNWFHFKCFWRRARVTTHTDIHGFDALRWEDQTKIKDMITGGGTGSGGKEAGDSVDGAVNKDFSTEYAKSNRSKCRGCESNIDKDLVRLGKKEYESERAKIHGPQTLWYHVDCFVSNRDELEFTKDMSPEVFVGFKSLKKDDRDMVVSKLGKGSGKKRKIKEEPAAAKKAKPVETPEEKALREQSKLLWDFRDKLTKNVSNSAMKLLLEVNGQGMPKGESKLLDSVADCMAFGALQACKECKEGQLVCGSGGYRCTGNISGWTKCQYFTKTPARKAFKIPAEFHDVDFLKKYKYVKRDRVFPKESVSTSTGPVSSASITKEKPLTNMRFVVIKSNKPSKDVKTALEDLGGVVVTKIDNTVAACISTREEVKRNGTKTKQAKKADVHVVSEDFLDAVKKGGAVIMIQQHSIAPWGGDPSSRIMDTVDGPVGKQFTKSAAMAAKAEALYTKSLPAKMKMMVKGGAAVDPDSGLGNSAHVLQLNGDPLTAVLGLVDIVSGTNSFYKLQVLETDALSRYYVFRAWGRVGTTIGSNKIDKFGSKNGAIAEFMRLYLDKTQNDWNDRKDFVKYPHKFYPLEIDYGQEEEEVKMLDAAAGKNSKLDKPVQDLIRLVFDVESMKKAMVEFEIDLKKMPLGKLSKNQIEKAYSVLSELQKLLDKKESPTKFLDASNRFYTLIPHDFGMKKPPMLDTQDVIKSKIDMLDNLLEIEVAYTLLKAGAEEGKDPIDSHYDQLKTEIKVLDKKSEEFTRLVEYVANTHAATHNMYDLEVEEIFTIKRDGEKSRYRPFRDLPNRQLLWHGSRITNYAGILSQGLRIAPPEAPVTGYMFGKGIYFADMVSKSANYCRTTKSNPTACLLLCEVALGNMHELTAADYITKLPKGKHSTKGVGMTTPDPANSHTTPDGVIIPMGKGIPIKERSSLLYNEYIVYDVAQVNVKYMLKTKFKYKF